MDFLVKTLMNVNNLGNVNVIIFVQIQLVRSAVVVDSDIASYTTENVEISTNVEETCAEKIKNAETLKEDTDVLMIVRQG